MGESFFLVGLQFSVCGFGPGFRSSFFLAKQTQSKGGLVVAQLGIMVFGFVSIFEFLDEETSS